MTARLELLEPTTLDSVANTITLSAGETTLGRAELLINDKRISRKAVTVRIDGQTVVVTRTSTNAAFVQAAGVQAADTAAGV